MDLALKLEALDDTLQTNVDSEAVVTTMIRLSPIRLQFDRAVNYSTL